MSQVADPRRGGSNLCQPPCPHADRVDKHERALYGPGESPEEGVVVRLVVIERLANNVVSLLKGNLAAIVLGVVAIITAMVVVMEGKP